MIAILLVLIGIGLVIGLLGSAWSGPWLIGGLVVIVAAAEFGPIALVIGLALLALAVWRRFPPPVVPIAIVAVVMAFVAPGSAPANAGGPVPGGPDPGLPGNVVVTSQIPLFADVPPGGYPHAVYSTGNCTWWVAYNHQIPAWAGDGDAWRWYGNAIRDGIPTSQAPSVGAVVVYRAGAAYSSHGHVAVVIAVGSNSFRVSEMNFVGLDAVDERTAPWPDPEIEGFIPR